MTQVNKGQLDRFARGETDDPEEFQALTRLYITNDQVRDYVDMVETLADIEDEMTFEAKDRLSIEFEFGSDHVSCLIIRADHATGTVQDRFCVVECHTGEGVTATAVPLYLKEKILVGVHHPAPALGKGRFEVRELQREDFSEDSPVVFPEVTPK